MTRLWLDTNVLVRFLVREPEDQAQQAAQLMSRAERGEVRLRLTRLVLAETFWVLKSFYGRKPQGVADVLAELVVAPGIEVDNAVDTLRALHFIRQKNVDVVDAFLAVDATSHEERVCTFDKTDFRKLPVQWTEP